LNFMEMYIERKMKTGSRLVVGLDPNLAVMPDGYGEVGRISDFFLGIIEATCEKVVGYKPNVAFFEQYGPSGLEELERVCSTIKETGALLILDAKRGDIGNTNRAYARAIFEHYGADATTLNPLLGFDSLGEFLEYTDRYMFVLNFTSNPGSELLFTHGSPPLYEIISAEIGKRPNCGAVAGATKTEYLARISEQVGDSLLLVPGIGAQGGSVERSIAAIGADKFIFNASRSVIFASSGTGYREAAAEKVDELNTEITRAMERVL